MKEPENKKSTPPKKKPNPKKLKTMHKALHLRDDIDKLYVSRNEEGRGLTGIQESVDASIKRLEDYIKSAVED